MVNSDPPGDLDAVATLATGAGRLALALGVAARWRPSGAYTLVPLGLPGEMSLAGTGDRQRAFDLAARALGCALSPAPGAWTYGPSSQHAIDRAPAATPDAAFLRFQRMEPPADTADATPRPVTTRVYLAHVTSDLQPSPELTSGVVWMPVDALRLTIRGLWLDDLRALDGVSLIPAAGVTLPRQALIYTPSDFGERLLLRACAKYGDSALFPSA